MLNYNRLMAKAGSYSVLSLLLGKPVEGLHNTSVIYDELIGNAMLLDPKMLELAKKLKASSENVVIAEMNTEYERLFTDWNEGFLACPYSSAYRNMKPVDGWIQWIEDEYKKADFVPRNNEIPIDHITTQLEFIYRVIGKAAAHLAKNEQAEAIYYSQLICNFIAYHALKWIPDFTRAIIFNSKSPFYLQLAILARTMLANCVMEQEASKVQAGISVS